MGYQLLVSDMSLIAPGGCLELFATTIIDDDLGHIKKYGETGISSVFLRLSMDNCRESTSKYCYTL